MEGKRMVVKIVLSAGHGPNTPGKRSPDGVKEFQFNYPTAEYLASYLSEYENVQLLKVYDKNRDVPLAERTQRANAWGANVYVSIHYNAFGSSFNTANGIETLVYSLAVGSWNGYSLAKLTHPKVIKATGRTDRGVKARPDLWELRATNAPAVLFECGFMTNQTERNLMVQASYQQKVARAICDGLVLYYGLKKKASTTPKPTPSTPTTTTPTTIYRIIVGSYSKSANAIRQVNQIKAKGIDAALFYDKGLYKVQAGAFSNYQNAVNQRNRLRQLGFKDAWISQ